MRNNLIFVLVIHLLLISIGISYAQISYGEEDYNSLNAIILGKDNSQSASSATETTTIPQQTGSVLDISGIEDIRNIPVGETKKYYFSVMNRGGITAEQILDSLYNLTIMTFGADIFSTTVKDAGTGNEETIIGGKFGTVAVKPILTYDECGGLEYIEVKHEEFGTLEGGVSPQDDEDYFLIVMDKYEIYFDLARRYGRPTKGFAEWGLSHIEKNWIEFLEDKTTQIKSLSLWMMPAEEANFSFPDPEGKFAAAYNEYIYPSAKAYYNNEPSEYSVLLFLEGSDEILKNRPLGP